MAWRLSEGRGMAVYRMDITNVGSDTSRINTTKPFYRQVTQGHLDSPPDRYIATARLVQRKQKSQQTKWGF